MYESGINLPYSGSQKCWFEVGQSKFKHPVQVPRALLSTETQWNQRNEFFGKIGHIYWNKRNSHLLWVNLFQKHLYLHQLNHSMTKDCSLNCEFSTWKLQAQNMLCTQIFFLFWHSEQFWYITCSADVASF